MSITVELDEDTAVDMLVNRVRYWTDDEEVIELFEQYYESMVDNGCFSGSNFDVMSIVDNDYVNNTSVTTREEFESERDKYIEEQLKKDGFDKEAEDFDIDEYNEALEEYEEDTPTWEDLERGENNLEFLSGYYIEAITDSCLLVSW
jgi:hypothetical protein